MRKSHLCILTLRFFCCQVATSSSNTFVSSTNKRVLETTVGIYLIDTVTGAVVFHTYHKNAQVPFRFTQCYG
jgi:hypothetical protein